MKNSDEKCIKNNFKNLFLNDIFQAGFAMSFCIFLTIVLINLYESVKSKNVFDEIQGFTGQNFWGKSSLEHCDTKFDKLFMGQNADPKLKCYIYQLNLNFVKVEVLNIDPPLVKFPQFFSKTLVNKFLNETEKVKLGELLVKSSDGPDRNVHQQSRIANGTFLSHYFSDVTTFTFNYIQNRINALNFAKAEDFQVLSYKPGGHYAPHFDHLVRNYDLFSKGNRFATFMVILKSADIGGGTIYPNIGVTFQPKPGDAVVWLNMNTDYGRSEGSLHGACPVVKGVKVGLTLWVRSHGQELRWNCPLKKEDPFPLKPLIQPKWLKKDWPLRYGFPLFG
uniref:Fe2OG dioxygenase domain-containing protein n=1 Tax=Panagrolaimus davidi TaxID=227884 RepID=A0A914QAA6_9BILA